MSNTITDTRDPRIDEAFELHRAEKSQEGIALLDALLAENPQDRWALFARGCIRVGSEDAENAIKDWELALGDAPEFISVLESEQAAWIEKAFRDFHFETTVEANNSNVHSALGRACQLFGRLEEAVVHLARASELSRAAWRDGVLCAELQVRLGQIEAALQGLNTLLETRQDNGELHYQVGILYQAQGAGAFALKHLERAVQLEPADSRARLALGELYLQQARFEQGEQQLSKALQVAPSARAHLGLAECMRGLYRFEEALSHLKQAAEIEPNHLRALTELGSLALQFGDLELGVECLKKALAINPDLADIHALLAKAAQQKGDTTTAIESYLKMLELAPTEIPAMQALAGLYRGQNEYSLAAEWLEKANHDGAFKGSISINHHDPQRAVEEIEKWAGHPGYRQVMIGHYGPRPYGHPMYDPIWEAAARHSLPIAVHFRGGATQPLGWTSTATLQYFVEYHSLIAPMAYEAHMVSWICNGVLDRHPAMKVLFVEGGFLWYRPLIDRLGRHWARTGAELAARRTPEEYVLDNFRWASQPIEEATNPRQIATLFEEANARELLMFSSDYPHYDYDPPSRALPRGLDEETRWRILSENAREVYGLPKTRPADRYDSAAVTK